MPSRPSGCFAKKYSARPPRARRRTCSSTLKSEEEDADDDGDEEEEEEEEEDEERIQDPSIAAQGFAGGPAANLPARD